MNLRDLLNDDTAPDMTVTGISADSRDITPGMIFAALPGVKVDGFDFIPKAIENGAAAVISDRSFEGVAHHIKSDHPRHTLATLAAGFYQRQPETIVAVTGSNGKTSVAHFTRQIWQMMDYKAASLGTTGLEAEDIIKDGAMTTPDPIVLHQDLAALDEAGITHLAMEASSHGIDQSRLDGVKLKAAGFTNLTRDHLDYHKTMDNYAAAKFRLFRDLLPAGGAAVLNADVAEYAALKDICAAHKIIDYGEQATAIKINRLDPTAHGLALSLDVFGEASEVELPLVGRFQAYNVLCALGLAIGSENAVPSNIITYLERLKGVKGRVEYIGRTPKGGAVYVDYAHTPDGIVNVLSSLRPHTKGKLHIVFGCGGDRDTGKRPEMGAAAANGADRVIVTDDNPRSEDPAAIRAAVMTTCPDAKNIGGREEAIAAGIDQAESGDILVIAGKGHETGQTIGDTVIPFNDAEVVRNYL